MVYNSENTDGRVRITYNHQIKQNTILEVVGLLESTLEDEVVLVRRLDGALIDIPRMNIVKFEQLT